MHFHRWLQCAQSRYMWPATVKRLCWAVTRLTYCFQILGLLPPMEKYFKKSENEVMPNLPESARVWHPYILCLAPRSCKMATMSSRSSRPSTAVPMVSMTRWPWALRSALWCSSSVDRFSLPKVKTWLSVGFCSTTLEYNRQKWKDFENKLQRTHKI